MTLVAAVTTGLTVLGQTPSDKIVRSAVEQAKLGAVYDASYVRLRFPGGDVPLVRGACTDVVIRCLRSAGYDLQAMVNKDAKSAPRAYPGIKKPDSNIDHRRVRNLVVFFKRHGQSLSIAKAAEWKPGDIVYWKLDNGIDHIGVLISMRGTSGNRMVVHNLRICQAEDCLTHWKILGHYRFPKG